MKSCRHVFDTVPSISLAEVNLNPACSSAAPSADSLASEGSVDVFLTEGASLGSTGSSESRLYSPEMPEERIVYVS